MTEMGDRCGIPLSRGKLLDRFLPFLIIIFFHEVRDVVYDSGS